MTLIATAKPRDLQCAGHVELAQGESCKLLHFPPGGQMLADERFSAGEHAAR
jgi:hypothetical protein